ncbi:MAG: sulfatase-like hydrolase/transferase [Candidatus Poribacteria bacterium]|nr:sulfatase-like hydrolase/transferase [Candidatus Poribacteria bacterium]
MKAPNILFLMSDEHRADVTGYEGNGVIRTPTLDWLAETGTVFRDAYTPSPICVPGRQCLMSGQLPKTVGCEGWVDLQSNHMTFARQLSRYAYETVSCGKLHHQGDDQMQGWTQRPAGDVHISSNHISNRSEAHFQKYSRSFSTFKWSDAKEIKRAGVGRSPCVTRDRFWTDSALHFIDDFFNSAYYDREQGQRPLLLKVSLLQPHYPYQTDHDKFTYYLNRVVPYLDQSVFPHPFLSQRQVRPGTDASEREIRRATAAYYGMVETIDSHYQEVLEALTHVGENLDEWMIVYTSDHGEMLGEHGIWEKQKFFEASVRVPLIIRYPERFEAKVIDQNVNLCDLFATLCHLAGIPCPSGLDSRTLVPLMEGCTENWANETVSQFGKTNLMIKKDHLKYQDYGVNGKEVLFDLHRDPSETQNFIDDPDYVESVSWFRQRLSQLGHGPKADPNYVNAGYTSDLRA